MKQTSQHRILIVNDASEQLKLMNHMLRQAGYQVINALEGREALAMAKNELPDLIISDISMPEIDGVELCRMIRSRKELSTIPIILVTDSLKDSETVVEGMGV